MSINNGRAVYFNLIIQLFAVKYYFLAIRVTTFLVLLLYKTIYYIRLRHK